MYTLKYLRDNFRIQKEIDGEWVPARPYPGTIWFRVNDAWKVLNGEADAFTWHGRQ